MYDLPACHHLKGRVLLVGGTRSSLGGWDEDGLHPEAVFFGVVEIVQSMHYYMPVLQDPCASMHHAAHLMPVIRCGGMMHASP